MSDHRPLVLIAISTAVVALDQLVKLAVRHLSAPHELLGGLVTLLYTENAGAFLSLGAQLPAVVRELLFGAVVAIVIAVALYTIVTRRVHGSDAVAVAMIAGGGLGNLIDRLLHTGRVTDFLYLSIGALHTGVFNLADVAITGGVAWLFLSSMLPRKR